MGFARGRITFRRFFSSGGSFEAPADELLAAIDAHAFGRHGAASSDGIEFGWIVPNHLFDVDFSDADRIAFDKFLFLAMRMDRTAAPSAIVQSYRRMEEGVALEAKGGVALNRVERKMARQAADDRAEKEARAGMFRRTAAYPVLIDLQSGAVYFGHLGASGTGKLLALFSDTFDRTLAPATADEAAFRIAEKRGWQKTFDDAGPTQFISPPSHYEVNSNGGERDHSFLGREFLLWLWWHCDAKEGVFELQRYGSVTVAVEKVLDLSCAFGFTGTAALRSELPSTSPEANAALKIGKLPTKMGLLVHSSHAIWPFVLDGANLAISGLTVPKPDEGDEHDTLVDRFCQIVDSGMLLDDLYAEFLAHRLGKTWKDRAGKIQGWLSHGQSSSTLSRPMQLASA